MHKLVFFFGALSLVGGCQTIEEWQGRKYKNHHLKMIKANQSLQIRVMEYQAVADNLPRFQEEVNKVCAGKTVDIKPIPRTEASNPNPGIPSFYARVPEKFRKAELVEKHIQMLKKLHALSHVVVEVERFKRMKKACKPATP